MGDKHRVLIVDDDPNMHQISEMSLKRVKFQDQRLDLLFASSAKEAIAVMGSEENIALIVLDEVMESDKAGLEVCRAVREDLGNSRTRILLRTGKEPEGYDAYDVEGYLDKGEMTAQRLVEAVTNGLNAYQ